MKLPRWLMIGMLTSSVLAVLTAAGWSWVTWPERTAREFVMHMAGMRWDKAGSMMGWSSEQTDLGFVSIADTDPRKWSFVDFKPEARTVKDILQGNGCWVSKDGLFVHAKRDKVQYVNISSEFQHEAQAWLNTRRNHE